MPRKATDLPQRQLTGSPAKGLPEKQWACKINFYHEIVPEQTKQMPYTGRDLLLIIRKKELKAEYWPRLTKEPLNRNWIKTDFTRWADEDEQEEAPVEEDDMAGMGGMPGMPGMGGMGGMPGMGGAGGMPGGMDMASLMGGMGGGGAGAGAGGMDFVSCRIATALTRRPSSWSRWAVLVAPEVPAACPTSRLSWPRPVPPALAVRATTERRVPTPTPPRPTPR